MRMWRLMSPLALSLAFAAEVLGGGTPVSSAFNYQGRLLLDGTPVDEAADFRFRLFDAASGGTQIGPTIDEFARAVDDGLFEVDLDFGAVFTDEQRWLEIEVRVPAGSGGYTTLSPRQPIMAVPVALFALNVDGASVTGIDAANIAAGTLPDARLGGTYGNALTFNNAANTFNGSFSGDFNGNGVSLTSLNASNISSGTIDPSHLPDGGAWPLSNTLNFDANTLVIDPTTNRVGVGLSSPQYPLHVEFSGDRAIYGEDLANTGRTYGGFFRSRGDEGRGVLAWASSNVGETFGGWFRTSSDEGIGVFSWASASTGFTFGLRGEADSPDGRGVFGTVTDQDGFNVGVQGQTSSTDGIGVFGVAANVTGQNIGVYGLTNSANGYAGWFDGRLHVNGTLSKTAGAFRIDHPLDPANKYLVHSFVESPDMMNVYNGNVITDEDGYATVELPDYFQALNRDFRYQLTVIGEFAQAIIAEEIDGNQFVIRTDKPNVKVSWQVTGVRQDAWAEANRIAVEEEKRGGERGRYLHPELHGVETNQGIHSARHLIVPERTREEQ